MDILKNNYNNTGSIIKKKELELEIQEKNKYIHSIDSEEKINQYKDRVSDIINNNELSDIETENYLEIAKKYINIEIIKNLEENIICQGCKKDLKDYIENLEGIYICPECHCINNYIKPIKHIKDTEHYLIDNNDDDINNFIRFCLNLKVNVSNIPDSISR